MRRRVRTFRRRLRDQLQRKRIIARPPFGKRSGRRRAVALVAVAVLGMAASAQAFWSAHGSGTASGSVATLAAPTISSATAGAGSVELAWTTVTPPVAGGVTYYVSRDGGAAGEDCPSSAAPSTQTSCTDTGVSVGTHSYTVTAVWRSWTARSQASSVHVSFGPATHLLLTPASTTPTAGTGDALTITAQDASNNTVATYTGEKSLTFGGASAIGIHAPTVSSSTGSAIAMGTPEPISFSNGVASVSGTSNGLMTLYKAETASITVTDSAIGNGSGVSVTVKPASAVSLTVPAPAAQTAGTAFNETLTAKDEYGNLATGYAGEKTVAFSGPSNSPSGKAPSYPASVSFAEGAGKASITLYDAQSTTLTAKEGTLAGTSGGFTVNPAGAATFAVANPGTQAAGKSFEDAITAKDEYGNLATGYAGEKAVAFSGPSSSPGSEAPKYPASVSFNEGAGKASITLYDAQSTTLTANQGSITGTSESFTVNATAIASISISNPGTQTAGTSFTLVITAKDTYGNGVAGSQALTFSGPAESPNKTKPTYPSSATFASGEGKASITLTDAQSTTVTVAQGSIKGASTEFTVKPAAAVASFSLPTPGTQAAGKAFEEAMTALDSFGNTATSYTGSKTIAFSGPSSSPSGEAAKYPSSVTFGEGVGKASITLTDAQSTALTAKEGTISGSSASFTVKAGTATNLAWNSSSSSNPLGKLTGPCLFTCVYKAIEGEGTTFKAKVAVTDSLGNVESAIGTGVTVTVSKTDEKGNSKFTGSEKVTIPATGEAISNSGGDGSVAGEITFVTEKGSWKENTLGMTNTGTYTNATAAFSKK